MARKWKFRVEHILEAIARIQRYTVGMAQDTFGGSEMTVDAVIRNFQVIGEAARKIPEDVQAAHPEIPWSLMQGMRHILVHDYDAVKLDVVWRTIEELPQLIEPLKNILVTNEE